MTGGPDNFVLYDGECPICRSYMALAGLRRLRPDFKVLDARHEPEIVAALRVAGYDVNDSIIVKLGSTTYAGADATRLISVLGSNNPLMPRIALYILGGAPWSRALYPLLRATRNGLLRVLGKPKVA
jgi:predicted DCC family thiol-disulfide oxidoreductase YuxK